MCCPVLCGLASLGLAAWALACHEQRISKCPPLLSSGWHFAVSPQVPSYNTKPGDAAASREHLGVSTRHCSSSHRHMWLQGCGAALRSWVCQAARQQPAVAAFGRRPPPTPVAGPKGRRWARRAVQCSVPASIQVLDCDQRGGFFGSVLLVRQGPPCPGHVGRIWPLCPGPVTVGAQSAQNHRPPLLRCVQHT
jgi:hypothetical protein